MQLGGIGSDHIADSHQVTNCMHSHAHYRKDGGGAAASSAMNSQMLQVQQQQQQQEAQLSLSAWLQKTLEKGKSLLKGIWGSALADSSAANTDEAGQEQVMAPILEDVDADGQEAGITNRMLQVNPYFQTVQDRYSTVRMTPLQRIRVKVKGVTGQLAGKLPGRFFRFQAKNSFHAKSEQGSAENLKKRSKYRKDDLEIDCILTDESYLLDSYDRKGEYSRLTTKK